MVLTQFSSTDSTWSGGSSLLSAVTSRQALGPAAHRWYSSTDVRL